MKKIKLTLAITVSTLLFACEKQGEGGIAEMAKSAETWVKQQQLFVTERGSLADCELTAYTTPEKSKDFFYECSFKENLVVWTAMNKNKLDNCVAGNKWKISVFLVSDEYGISPELPEAEPCHAITPISFNNAKKEISEETIRKQAAIDSIAALQNAAIVELEQESKKWHNSLKKQAYYNDGPKIVVSHSYKSPKSDFFTYKGTKEGNFHDYFIWTATSKIKMGDCPAGSVWRMLWFCEMECSPCECPGGKSEIPSRCRNITPKSVIEYRDPAQQ